jgi:hypothetical protein
LVRFFVFFQKIFEDAGIRDINGCFFSKLEGGNILGELHDWLVGQHPGLRTYKSFQQQALQLALSDAEHRALYRLLASMVGRYIESFDEEPLPVDVAKNAYQRLLNIVDDAEKSIGAPASEQVKTLNKVAATELF